MHLNKNLFSLKQSFFTKQNIGERDILVVILDINDIKEFLSNIICSRKTAIAFVGSPLRKDDRIALLIYHDLMNKLKNNPDNVWFIECEYGLENCLHEIIKKKPEVLIIVDAILSQELRPGEIVLVSWEHVKEKIGLATTHNIPVSITLSLLRKQVDLQEIYLLGIRAENIGIGMDISESVNKGRKKIIDLFLKAITECGERKILA